MWWWLRSRSLCTQHGRKLIGSHELAVGSRGDKFYHPEHQPAELRARLEKFAEFKLANQQAHGEGKPIRIEVCFGALPGGSVTVLGLGHHTLPVELFKLLPSAELASEFKTLLKSAVVGRVTPLAKAELEAKALAGLEDDGDEREKEGLWDLMRPLETDCRVELLDFDSKQGQHVFWHSSAHVLGQCLENGFGAQLTTGPATPQGFFYDSYMGPHFGVDEDMKRGLERKFKQACKHSQPFERLEVTKPQALELFRDNPFKLALIESKIKDGEKTTVYKVGPMIDLCRGPHIRNTREIKAMAVLSSSQANFLGDSERDSLQRVYGVSFPTPALLDEHLFKLKEERENDHRKIGKDQELFFTHPLSPGSAFFEPGGTRIYNRLVEFIRREYLVRGYQEVQTPNLFHTALWKQSGHWQHYAENMFCMPEEDMALKPMNCPGHCLLFAHRDRSYRELPLRFADFGVLHRNEVSGSLSGLTRVRKFVQDDAHIFCTNAQIKQEIVSALEFMKKVYVDTFGMSYTLERSTRPAKAVGLETEHGLALWNDAEQQLADALTEFQGTEWKDNVGDGAFYGPKIDVKVMDSAHRVHQCATIQLDFQLPQRFNLQYDSHLQTKERPVMVHRAMLGSVERFIAMLTEHFKGYWPFWLSPRQAMVVPMVVGQSEENRLKIKQYCDELVRDLTLQGFYVQLPHLANEDSRDVIKEAFKLATSFCLCVGVREVDSQTVSVAGRQVTKPLTASAAAAAAPIQYGTCSLQDLKLWFAHMQDSKTLVPVLELGDGRKIFTANTFARSKGK